MEPLNVEVSKIRMMLLLRKQQLFFFILEKREICRSDANAFLNEADVVGAKQQKKSYEQHPWL